MSKPNRMPTNKTYFSACGICSASSPDLFVIRFEDWELASSKGIEGVVWLLRILQLLVSSVAFVGIINLTMVTIFDRNKEFSIYKSSGMSLKILCSFGI